MGFQVRHGVVFLPVRRQHGLRPPEAVQISPVLLLIQKLLAVVLAVDVQQFGTDLPQLADCDGAAIGPTGILAVTENLPLQKQRPVLIRGHTVGGQSRQFRGYTGKLRTDKSLIGPGADQLPGSTAAQHRAHGVDDDGLTGAGLAGKGVKARAKLNVRRLNDRDILNVQQFQHGLALPFPNPGSLCFLPVESPVYSIALISSQKIAADSVSCISKNAVSSPAREPSI